jgi:hypothetical protein
MEIFFSCCVLFCNFYCLFIFAYVCGNLIFFFLIVNCERSFVELLRSLLGFGT